MTTAAKLLEVARGEIGYREGANNSNKYGAWYGYPNVAWCAQFVSWCANEAGLLGAAIPKFQWTPSGANWFRERGRYGRTPRVGAVGFVYYESKGRIGHTFIVEQVHSDGTISTIEGNTNTSGSSQGIGVFRLRRRVTSNLSFGYPDFSKAAKKSTVKKVTVWSGATLTAIAVAAGVPLSQILDHNPGIKNPNVIKPGDVITLPPQADPVVPPNAEPDKEPPAKPEAKPPAKAKPKPKPKAAAVTPLRLNQRSSAVARYEECLVDNGWGLSRRWEDGYYGTETVEATNRVINSQPSQLRPADGVAGPKTQKAACETKAPKHAKPKTTVKLRIGSEGAAVREIQAGLRKLGYNQAVTGYYGPVTARNVDHWVRRHKGLGAADGTAGPLTQQSIKRAAR